MTTTGFGGGCHWCTEAIFQSLRGVADVQQGWIASADAPGYFSEAVLVIFDPAVISMATLIAVHLHTHSSTSSHSMRIKYRSAVYVLNESEAIAAREAINAQQEDFESQIITEVLQFEEFRLNKQDYLNYYKNDPEKPFCRIYISPKLRAITERFGEYIVRNSNETV